MCYYADKVWNVLSTFFRWWDEYAENWTSDYTLNSINGELCSLIGYDVFECTDDGSGTVTGTANLLFYSDASGCTTWDHDAPN